MLLFGSKKMCHGHFTLKITLFPSYNIKLFA